MGDSKKSDRVKAWGFVMYPESMPEDWHEKLTETHVRMAISPLHDKDENPDGTPKKSHYHVAIDFDSVKTYQQVYEITSSVNGTVPQRIKSLKGNVRYFTHMDNPEKAQYSRDTIMPLNGFDVESMFTASATERYAMCSDMMDFCDNNDVVEFSTLMKYARQYQRETWFPLLMDSCSYVMGQYIKSLRHKRVSDDA